MTVMAAFRLQLAPLLCLFAMCAAAQELTEKQVLRLFRGEPLTAWSCKRVWRSCARRLSATGRTRIRP